MVDDDSVIINANGWSEDQVFKLIDTWQNNGRNVKFICG